MFANNVLPQGRNKYPTEIGSGNPSVAWYFQDDPNFVDEDFLMTNEARRPLRDSSRQTPNCYQIEGVAQSCNRRVAHPTYASLLLMYLLDGVE